MVENIRMVALAALCALASGCAHWAPMPAPVASETTEELLYVGHRTVSIIYTSQAERAGILSLLKVEEEKEDNEI